MLIADLAALVQVVLIDLALAADNAVAVGLAAAALPAAIQKRAIFWGIVFALVLRILFAGGTAFLLTIPGLLSIGGLLLFWVAWRMWADIQHHASAEEEAEHEREARQKAPKTFWRALTTIVIADVSMSLDNVLAVAAVSKHNTAIMAFGLILSVLLMGVAAAFIARVIHKYRWIAMVGVIVIVFAGVRMLWEDGHNFFPQYMPALPTWLGGHA